MSQILDPNIRDALQAKHDSLFAEGELQSAERLKDLYTVRVPTWADSNGLAEQVPDARVIGQNLFIRDPSVGDRLDLSNEHPT